MYLWIKNKRKKTMRRLWEEHDVFRLSGEGVAFLLGVFSVSMGIALLGVLVVMIALTVWQQVIE